MEQANVRRAPMPLRRPPGADVLDERRNRRFEVAPDPEEIKRDWESTKGLLSKVDEATKITAGLELMLKMGEPHEGDLEEVPGLRDAEKFVDKLKALNPDIPDKRPIIQMARGAIRQELQREMATARAQGVELPTGPELTLLRQYLDLEVETTKRLEGLQALEEKDPKPTRAKATAQHFLARLGSENIPMAKAKAGELLRAKKTELKEAGILVP